MYCHSQKTLLKVLLSTAIVFLIAFMPLTACDRSVQNNLKQQGSEQGGQQTRTEDGDMSETEGGGGTDAPGVRSFSLDEACQAGNQWRYLKRGDSCWRIGMDCAPIALGYAHVMDGQTIVEGSYYSYQPGRQFFSAPDDMIYSPEGQYDTYDDMVYNPTVAVGDELICTYLGDKDVGAIIESEQNQIEELIQDRNELFEQGLMDNFSDAEIKRLRVIPRAEFFKVTETGYYSDGYSGSKPNLTIFDSSALLEAGIETVDFDKGAPYYLCESQTAAIASDSGTETVEFEREYLKTENECTSYSEQVFTANKYLTTIIPDLEPGEYIVSLAFDIPGDSPRFKITVA